MVATNHPFITKFNLSRLNRKTIMSYSAKAAEHYRACDQRDVRTPASREVIRNFQRICGSFSQRINVLDVGCGSGRFFHALSGVKELTGLDISRNMLEVAKHPLKGGELDVQKLKLVEGDCFSILLPTNSFDFIYAIGVFGHPIPLDTRVINKLYELLAPGGTLFLTAANADDEAYQAAFKKSMKRRVIEWVSPLLGRKLQSMLSARWAVFFRSESELQQMMADSKFEDFEIWKMVNRFIAIEAHKPIG